VKGSRTGPYLADSPFDGTDTDEGVDPEGQVFVMGDNAHKQWR
jgi:hypothetical protein